MNNDPLGVTALLRTGFHAEVDRFDGAVVVRLQGELDMYAAPTLSRDLVEALDAMPHTISLDLRELSFLDSTGIRVLVGAHRRAAAQGCGLRLRSPQASVLRVLKLTGIDHLLVIDSSDVAG